MQTTSDKGNDTAALPRLMDQATLAEYLGKSQAWAERARWEGTGPRFLKLGRHVRYRASDVLEWLEANVQQTTPRRKRA
jgi:predicted DNA-binding transcriptional regulator AlpA